MSERRGGNISLFSCRLRWGLCKGKWGEERIIFMWELGLKCLGKMWVSILRGYIIRFFGWGRRKSECRNWQDFNSCRACPSCPVWAIIMPIREKSFRKNFLLRGASKYSPLKRKALQIFSISKYYIIKLFDSQSIIHSNISIIKVLSIKTFWLTK